MFDAAAAISASPISLNVTCTVVSVMPNMLMSRASGRNARHRRSSAGLSASPPKITYRTASVAPRVTASSMSGWNADGTWLSTVVPVDSSSARNSAEFCATVRGTITARPPKTSAPNSSHTEKSKANE